MVVPVMIIGVLVAVVLGIVIFAVTDPVELIILAVIGAFVVSTVYK